MEFNFISEFVDIGVLIALVGIIETIKAICKEVKGSEPEKKLPFIIIFASLCLVSSFFISLQAGSFSETVLIGIGTTAIKFIKYLGIGTVCYKFILKWIKKKTEADE